ncbi:unnamed protein product [Symbiodinium sp. CCMP2592]|nr:unnamed protein product [Symbiodinium sp. CCMP2592]
MSWQKLAGRPARSIETKPQRLASAFGRPDLLRLRQLRCLVLEREDVIWRPVLRLLLPSWGEFPDCFRTTTHCALICPSPGYDGGSHVAEGSEPDVDVEPKADVEPKLEKRKRERKREAKAVKGLSPSAKPVPDTDEEDEEFDSPSKRASTGGERPISARELRNLLSEHRQELNRSWHVFENRIGKVENLQRNQTGEIASVAGRVKITEKEMVGVKKSVISGEKKIEQLAEDVANMKVQLEEVRQNAKTPQLDAGKPPHGAEGEHAGGVGGDPWAEYLRKNRIGTSAPGVSSGNIPPASMGGNAMEADRHDQLSDEDKKTLIVGGWLQDTRKNVIEEESAALLQNPEIRPLLDVDKLAVYGPRRSVGMLRFKLREDEQTYEQLKTRMWKVVRAVSQLKLQVASAKNLGEDKTMWASFVKTKTARTRSAHISMVRRVCMALAADAKDEAGGVLNLEHTQVGAYDMDWNAGTIWCGIHKLASSTHRCPRDAESITMTGGWINLDAVGLNEDSGMKIVRDEVQVGGQSKTLQVASDGPKCARHLWGRAGQWNVGGQKLELLDEGGKDLDILLVQEMTRSDDGWDSLDTPLFHWVSHRKSNHYRGVAIGIANDKLDCVIDKRASSRGLWILAKLKGLGRVALGTMHAHTGATNAIYQAAIHDFVNACPRKWRQYPLLCGIDANEELKWHEAERGFRAEPSCSSTNLDEVVHQLLQLGASPLPPVRDQWDTATHYPRDTSRKGRQIDMIGARHLDCDLIKIDASRRHVIGSDHALLHVCLYSQTRFANRWGNDSRPRYMSGPIPEDTIIVDSKDITELARQCTRPRLGKSYRDDEEIKAKAKEARSIGTAKAWKDVHRLRRRAKREWEKGRLRDILHGDWHQYRALQRERTRKKGWWGKMLADRSSTENTSLVHEHLKRKLVNEFGQDWNDILQQQIDSVHVGDEFERFSVVDVREVLSTMKVNCAVGPDGISVALLREAMSHDVVGPQILDLVNHIVEKLEFPEEWEENFLALLAKCEIPTKAGDLRPICVSSVFHKMITKLVCQRAMPKLRVGSRISGCGKGRQAADVIGTISRVRDVAREWQLPVLLCKLDISGAFDRLDRQKVVEFLKARLADCDMSHELKYLLAQLRTYHLKGIVPGGHEIGISPNIGIKQGAPESAEVFGLVMNDLLSGLVDHRLWQQFGRPLTGLDLELVFYQDDIFIVESELGRLCKRIRVLERCLAKHGLHLATEKTKIVASAAYRGARQAKVGDALFQVAGRHESVKVLGLSFNLQDSPSQQAKELLHRTRTAAATHRDLLRGRAGWGKKADMVRTLVESQFAWTGGAIHWSADDLRQANTIQLHTLRSAFRMGRHEGESWVEWNGRCRMPMALTGLSSLNKDTSGILFLEWAITCDFNFDMNQYCPLNCELHVKTLEARDNLQFAPASYHVHSIRMGRAGMTMAWWFGAALLGLVVDVSGTLGEWYRPGTWETLPPPGTWITSPCFHPSFVDIGAFLFIDDGIDFVGFGILVYDGSTYLLDFGFLLSFSSGTNYLDAGIYSMDDVESVAWVVHLAEDYQTVEASPPLPHEMPVPFLTLPVIQEDATEIAGIYVAEVQLVQYQRLKQLHAGSPADSDEYVKEWIGGTMQMDEAPFVMQGPCVLASGPAIKGVTFYGDSFYVRANLDGGEGECSTTAGEDDTNSGDIADVDTENDTEQSSSSNSTPSVGFYRHGEWQARPRTPWEHRQHTGGRGLQRTRKQDERMRAYLEGRWKPAWLVKYAKEKEARRGRDLPQVPEDSPPAPEPRHEQTMEPPAPEEPQGEQYNTDTSDEWTNWSWDASWPANDWSWSWQTGQWADADWQDDSGNPQWSWDGVTAWTSPVSSTDDLAASQAASSSTSTTTSGSMESKRSDMFNGTTLTSTVWGDELPWGTALSSSSTSSTTSLPIGGVTQPFPDPWMDWGWISTLTTSSTTMASVPPNYGLYPEVRPAHLPLGDEDNLMAITNSEVAMLQEAGVPRGQITRITNMLATLDEQQRQGRGPVYAACCKDDFDHEVFSQYKEFHDRNKSDGVCFSGGGNGRASLRTAWMRICLLLYNLEKVMVFWGCRRWLDYHHYHHHHHLDDDCDIHLLSYVDADCDIGLSDHIDDDLAGYLLETETVVLLVPDGTGAIYVLDYLYNDVILYSCAVDDDCVHLTGIEFVVFMVDGMQPNFVLGCSGANYLLDHFYNDFLLCREALINEAIEESLTWIQTPLSEVPMNARHFEAVIMSVVHREAGFGIHDLKYLTETGHEGYWVDVDIVQLAHLHVWFRRTFPQHLSKSNAGMFVGGYEAMEVRLASLRIHAMVLMAFFLAFMLVLVILLGLMLEFSVEVVAVLLAVDVLIVLSVVREVAVGRASCWKREAAASANCVPWRNAIWKISRAAPYTRPTGPFSASAANAKGDHTGSSMFGSWLRDNCIIAYGIFLTDPDGSGGTDAVACLNSIATFLLTYQSHKMELVINGHKNVKGDEQTWMDRPHIRFIGETGKEDTKWYNHKQNDALGYFLWARTQLALAGKMPLTGDHLKLCAQLFDFLRTIECWEDLDAGHWEEHSAQHASSLGPVLAAVRSFKKVMAANPGWIFPGKSDTLEVLEKSLAASLKQILPNEVVKPRANAKDADGALIFLCYPLEVVDDAMGALILQQMEKITGHIAVCRYRKDSYWCKDYKVPLFLSQVAIAADVKGTVYVRRLLGRCELTALTVCICYYEYLFFISLLVPIGSPTELAESSEEEKTTGAMDTEVKQEKRKREVRAAATRGRRGRGRDARAGTDGVHGAVSGDLGTSDDEDEESPSKRAQVGDPPLSGNEMRELLFGHMKDMKEAWRTFQGRMDKVEAEQLQQSHEMINIRTRTSAIEKDNLTMNKKHETMVKNMEELAEDVRKMKVQFDEAQRVPPPEDRPKGLGMNQAAEPSDPWAEFYRRKEGRDAKIPGPHGQELPGDRAGDRSGDTLSEDEKRTLVIGGWARDTKRTIIETESAVLFTTAGIQELIDSPKLAIYGPRRSVGMLKFNQRQGENFADVKNRMWEVIKLVANTKFELGSTREFGEVKNMWASFVKTRNARMKSAHVSMVRRVCCDLAMSSKNAEGGVKNLACTQFAAYDCDWSLGTIWSGSFKLASATHKQPREAECILMPGGWVALDAISGVTGQNLRETDVAVSDSEIVLVQEVARGKEGWSCEDTDNFHWITHRHHDQWRATGIGIATDRLDSIIHKVASPRGVWILARIHGLGRIVCGSMHGHTGVTNAVYQGAVLEFFSKLPAKWRQYPLLCGIDANEVPKWDEIDEHVLAVGHCSENLNVLLDEVTKNGCRAVPPFFGQRCQPTHFPRDETRVGRQIDMLITRSLHCQDVVIEPDRRYVINTDHALLHAEIFNNVKPLARRWGNDSRARWVHSALPDTVIVDEEDLQTLAGDYTRPRRSLAYHDSADVKDMIQQAKRENCRKTWKRVHRCRRQDRRTWETQRLQRILVGGWEDFRALQNEKKKKKGWWGQMLQSRSSQQLTAEVKDHLVNKMVSPCMHDWDEVLQRRIEALPSPSESCPFQPFSLLEIRTELQQMRCRSAVGPDGISVHLLREIASHDTLAPQLLDLVNHIVRTQESPRSWAVSFLALLAKCNEPTKVGELRPICVSSAFNKLVNRLVCSRALPKLRRGSRISACGSGRQAADLIGSVSRIRDVVHEWRLPCLLCKLDVAGAFDRVDRRKVADLLCSRLENEEIPAELRYLLSQLHSHELVGNVPGGHSIRLSPNNGIKQGAPESAEIFGLLVDSLLSELVRCDRWQRMGGLCEDLLVSLLFYQDDVFLVDSDLTRLIKKIRIVDRCLAQAGLRLATEKTKIVASPEYTGARSAKVGEDFYQIATDDESLKVLGVNFSFCAGPSQQAQELLGRARAAAAAHDDILRAHGPWTKKIDMIRCLVESQWSWTAGAVHWSSQDLSAANTAQLQLLRRVFGIRRLQSETWVDWNKRSIRFCRVWLANNGYQRWSTKILSMQHNLHGHWARRIEHDRDRDELFPSLPMQALLWRSTHWWRFQQSLSDSIGMRHPGRFYASNPERQISEAHGSLWHVLAQNRAEWCTARATYLQAWDVKWSSGRQLALRF